MKKKRLMDGVGVNPGVPCNYIVSFFPTKFHRLMKRKKQFRAFATKFEALCWTSGDDAPARYVGYGYISAFTDKFVSQVEPTENRCD